MSEPTDGSPSTRPILIAPVEISPPSALERVLTYIVARLKEPSTYPQLVLVLTALGISISSEQRDAILIIGMMLAGAVGAALPDRVGKNTRADDEPQQPPKGESK